MRGIRVGAVLAIAGLAGFELAWMGDRAEVRHANIAQ
jgi:hypothetical protein